MVDPKYLATVLIAIPLIIAISFIVFQGTAENSRNAYELAVVNETSGTGAGNHTTNFDARTNTVSTIMNASDFLCRDIAGCDSRVTYDPFGPATIDSGNLTVGPVLVTYTSYQGGGYDAFSTEYSMGLSSFQLGSNFTYIMIAMMIITVVLAAFGISNFL